eukprot:CAMPEP_0197601912 /NCGR_PEP_ID=MMETSP1326-20131121/36181_1 /TAXON_ID=1155430 /ORGANISM="Genus nov. species nov., Strain RCC2288" /LENGTH=45 /DNA_ID= /DNA_START= /DNA_END= /DNA_ORIENTATION=
MRRAGPAAMLKTWRFRPRQEGSRPPPAAAAQAAAAAAQAAAASAR